MVTQKDPNPKGRSFLLPTLAIAASLIILSCCGIPPILTRIAYGRCGYQGGLEKVQLGMTEEDVIALIGPPHDTFVTDDHYDWINREGFFRMPLFSISFSNDGKVIGDHSH